MKRQATKIRSTGFTGIELLVVVVVLAIVLAIVVPLYLTAVSNSKKGTCRANMSVIAAAVMTERTRLHATDYSFAVGNPINATNEPDLPSVPTCPSAGTYSIVDGGATPVNSSFKVRCTKHGDFVPGSAP